MSVELLNLSEITVADRLRSVDEDWAKAIAQSIEINGLMEPIVVRPLKGGGYALVAGAHRFRGLELAGLDEAECKILDLTEAEARLAEIDENLMRREMNALDRAVFLAERKRVYEELHPEAAHGKAPNGGKVANIATLRFTEDVAEKIGLSERTIQDAVALVKRLTPEALDALRDTEIASNGAQLKALAKLEPADQEEIAELIKSGGIKSVSEGVALKSDAPAKKEDDPREAWFRAVRKTWSQGSKHWQKAFLEEIGAEFK